MKREKMGTTSLALAAGFLGGFLSHGIPFAKQAYAQAGPEEIRASRFVLVDSLGRERGSLQISASSIAMLELRGDNGSPVFTAKALPAGGVLSLQSTDLQTRVDLNGISSIPRIALSENRRTLIALDIVNGKEPAFHFFDTDQKARISYGMDHGDPYLAMMDKSGVARAMMSLKEGGSPSVTLHDANGDTLASYEISASGKAGMNFKK